MSLPTGGCSSPVRSARPERKPSPPSSPARAPSRAPAHLTAPQRAAPARTSCLPSALRRKAHPHRHRRRLSDNPLRRRQLRHRHLLLRRRDCAPPSGQGNASREGKLNPNWSGSTISTNCGVGPTSLTGDARTRFVPTLPRQQYGGVGMSARLSICLILSFSAFGKKLSKIWWDFVPQT
jgi:hypothetical protein